MTRSRWIAVLVVGLLIIAFFALDLGRYLSFDALKQQQAALQAQVAERPLAAAALYFVIYVAVTAVSLPGAAVLTVAGGAIFGFGWGLLLVSFASTIGATLAFLVARWLLRDTVQQRFGDRLQAVNAGIERDGGFYLFTLRLVPLFPFFVINLLMGLTPLRTWTYYWVSQLGMLAGTAVYVNAGTQLARIDSLAGIVSPGLLISFALLGLFPLIAKWVVDAVRARRVYARWPRPTRFDYNMVVIGAGSAGLVSAYIGAAVKARVALVERHEMGGDCLNTGCVPSKTLIRSARLLAEIRRAGEFGLKDAQATADFPAIMARVRRVIQTIAPHDSVARYTALGVDCLQGDAMITSPWTVEVRGADGDTRLLTTRHIVIAAGARPFVPPIPGLEAAGYVTSDTVWNLAQLPRRLVVLGGGPIGCELAQAFARLGARVTQVEMAPRLLMREDEAVSALVQARLQADGVQVLTGHTATAVDGGQGDKVVVLAYEDHEVRIPCDEILVAVGRKANTEGYGLERLGIETTAQHTLRTDDHLRTIYPNILAAGDVAGPFQFTHVAAHQAWYASVNALFGRFRSYRADYRVIPWATFTEPEVARVGINEQEARERGIPHQVTVYGIDDLDRAIADGHAEGFVKVITPPGRDTILGVTIVGAHAGELLAEYVLAMKHGLGLNKILGTIHTYPTMAEANKFAAGVWKRSTVTRGQWTVLEAFHAWQRGGARLSDVLRRVPRLWTDRRKAYTDKNEH